MIVSCIECGAKYNTETSEMCPICSLKENNLRIPVSYRRTNISKNLSKTEYMREYRKSPKWKKYNREWMRNYRKKSVDKS